MKIKKTKKLTLKRLLFFAALLAVVAGGAAFAWMNNQSKDVSNQTPDSSKSSDNKDNNVDEEAKPTKPPVVEDPDEPTTPDTSGPDTPAETPETPKIERASQGGQRGDDIKVVASLQEESSGTCEVRFERAGQSTISKTTNIVAGPPSTPYVCSFAIPVSQFPASGKWQVTVFHKEGDGIASSNTDEVLVQK